MQPGVILFQQSNDEKNESRALASAIRGVVEGEGWAPAARFNNASFTLSLRPVWTRSPGSRRSFQLFPLDGPWNEYLEVVVRVLVQSYRVAATRIMQDECHIFDMIFDRCVSRLTARLRLSERPKYLGWKSVSLRCACAGHTPTALSRPFGSRTRAPAASTRDGGVHGGMLKCFH